LPFADRSFDLVACQFGVMFFPDKAKGYAEMRRVLAPSGRVLASTWARLDKHGFANALCSALERIFPDDPPVFMSKIPHGYADPGRVEADLRAGGLELFSMETVTIEGTAASAADIATGFCTGTPLRAEIESRADLASTVAAVQADLRSKFGSGAVTTAMTAYVFEAQPR
jgi:SAM-dependent methyltransferase